MKKAFLIVLAVTSILVTLSQPTKLFAANFSTADLAGTWHFFTFFDLPSLNDPGWTRGTVTINSGGTVTGGSFVDSDGFSVTVTGGSLSLSSNGVISGSITAGGVTSTISQGKMDAGKTTVAFVGIDSQNFRFTGSAIKAGGTFATADLAGTWHFFTFFDLPSLNDPGWTRGTVTINSGGTVTSGSFVDSDGFSVTVTGGSLSLSSSGVISGSITSSGGVTSTISQGKMDAGKTTVAFVGIDSQNFRFTGTVIKAPIQTQLSNISTRGVVLTGDNVMIGGFIIGGTGSKTVLIRARGPTLADFGVPGELADPVIQLFSGQTVIAQNDDWEATDSLCGSPAVSCGGAAEVTATGLDPCVGNLTNCFLESAILVTLDPGPYTAIVSGVGGGTGVGLVEVFEVGTTTNSRLTNISTRGLVGTGDDVMIGGLIIGGTDPKTVLIRARGPTLADFGVPGELADPGLQLFSGQTVIAQNDDWQVSDPLCGSPAVSCGGQAEIVATGLDPCVGNLTGCVKESAILVTLPPGSYTAIVSGVGGGTGVGLVEVFEVNGAP